MTLWRITIFMEQDSIGKYMSYDEKEKAVIRSSKFSKELKELLKKYDKQAEMLFKPATKEEAQKKERRSLLRKVTLYGTSTKGRGFCSPRPLHQLKLKRKAFPSNVKYRI
ncbi:hypothetical protein FZX01_16050 [Listeria monocytogenes]|uniref:hypothetical protein n=1 Tax=Listeria monocytogenes TaxID=1639 RepID=UPI0011EB1C6A|nr:hypothetical protein [Listeria monocytogenes]TYU82202.1 hypothetical protein FZX01_16050 [Listeria monocytogenes]